MRERELASATKPPEEASLNYHITFSTKERRPLLTPELRSRTYNYIAGMIRSMGGIPVEINGQPDHLHLLIRWKPDESVSDLVKTIKSKSSGWINREKLLSCRFYWQEGFGAFSVSHSQIGAVRRYIQKQEEHHKKWSFQDEFRRLLDACGIEYDERYIWL